MKNVQVIDSAVNCTYDIFSINDRDFRLLFPNGTDIAFANEVFRRLGSAKARAITARLWTRKLDKKQVAGIHGTLFYQLDSKKKWYPTRREAEMIATKVSF